MCPFTVRVPQRCCLAGFLGSLITGAITSPRRVRCTIGVLLMGWICLPHSTHTPFNPLFRQGAAVSLLRHHITRCGSNGILTVSAIGLAFRLILRTRLTPGRLTLPGKPWSCGESASHTLYRYLYLHLLFQYLQQSSSDHLLRLLECSPTDVYTSHGFGCGFNTRLLSTHGPSTSELLRTL